MKEQNPILVWTMGKVGTSTVSRALARAGVPALHMHSIRPEVHKIVSVRNGAVPPHVRAALRALEVIEKSTGSVRIITMVRDPVARNISAFFENLRSFKTTPDLPTSDLIAIFDTEYPHHVPLEWFDLEIKYGIGFDIFQNAFDRNARFSRYSTGRFEILAMRVDADLSTQQHEISTFVGVPLRLVIDNAANSKNYKAAYQKFKNEISLSKEYIDRMYSSAFARHFWTRAELIKMSCEHLKLDPGTQALGAE